MLSHFTTHGFEFAARFGGLLQFEQGDGQGKSGAHDQ
jgi:hypothetical protein